MRTTDFLHLSPPNTSLSKEISAHSALRLFKSVQVLPLNSMEAEFDSTFWESHPMSIKLLTYKFTRWLNSTGLAVIGLRIKIQIEIRQKSMDESFQQQLSTFLFLCLFVQYLLYNMDFNLKGKCWAHYHFLQLSFQNSVLRNLTLWINHIASIRRSTSWAENCLNMCSSVASC